MGADSRKTTTRSRSRSRSRDRRSDRHRERSRERSGRRDVYERDSDRRRDVDGRRERSRDRREGRRERERDAHYSDRRSAYDSDREDRLDRWRARSEDSEDRRGGYEREEDRRHERKRSVSSYESGGYSSDGSDYEYRHSRRYSPRHRSYRQEPTATLYIRGIPTDHDESDLHRVFGSWPGIANIRVSRDRLTGKPRGFAFVEFESPDAAEKVLEREGRYLTLGDGTELTLEYSHTSAGGGPTSASLLDWICNRCQATNFARRIECHQCSTSRPPDALRVSSESEGPTPVLKVSNLDLNATEEALHFHISPVVPVKEVRLITDRQVGVPRGFAFVEFYSVADASKALHQLQDSKLVGQEKPLRLMFARDRLGGKPQASAAAENALQAAQQMAAYSNWAPKEFDESAMAAEERQQNGQPAVDTEASKAEAASGEFQYDPNSGYYYHAASGYYYDANSGLYYDSSEEKWKSYDPGTGVYSAVEADNGGSQATSAGSAALAAATAVVESMAHLQAPETEYKPPPNAKKRGAIIGSAAKLNPEGVLAAARETRLREETQKKQEAAKAAKAAKRSAKELPASAAAQGQPVIGATQQQAPPAGPVRGVIRSSGKWSANRNAGPA